MWYIKAMSAKSRSLSVLPGPAGVLRFLDVSCLLQIGAMGRELVVCAADPKVARTNFRGTEKRIRIAGHDEESPTVIHFHAARSVAAG